MRRGVPIHPMRALRPSLYVVAWTTLFLPAAAAVVAPCGDRSGAANARAIQTLKAMSQSEKLSLVHGVLGAPWAKGPKPALAIGSAGYAPGVPRLGVPALQETDAQLGIANPGDVRRGDTATAMPSDLALAATWDPALAHRQGEGVGAEARAKGFNVLLGGAANLIRDPRAGRTFEYLSEDPLLTGVMAGAMIDGVQSRGLISTTKHFALNDQESDRGRLDVRIDRAAARESDLLAFEIGVERGQPGAVMCAYNRINGEYACQNPWLLNDVLKGDWGYGGFVLSDWGAVHSTARAALAGLDQESGEQADVRPYFADLGQAVAEGLVPQSRLDDMARRILISMFACGLMDGAALNDPSDPHAVEATARLIEQEGAVLLRNDGVLPLATGLRRVLVVGAHADRGVPSGGGSSQVIPRGGIALKEPEGTNRAMVFDPSSPLDALRRRLPAVRIEYADGVDSERAAREAAGADAVILFVDQYLTEGADAPSLALPDGQDRLIKRVAETNPRTIVVLETGGPVLMPWLDRAAAVLETWYPGQEGGEAIADILTGLVNPAGRLTVTFPASEAQLPRPKIAASADAFTVRAPPQGPPIVVTYDEGARVGYKWFEERGERPLFPFGYGLSYTTFRLGDLTARAEGAKVTATIEVTNAGARAGAAIPQVYVTGPEGSGVRLRLAGWNRLELGLGETRRADVVIDPRLFATFDESARRWRIAHGTYKLSAGFDATRRDVSAEVALDSAELPP
jgi:beta-glucosidase